MSMSRDLFAKGTEKVAVLRKTSAFGALLASKREAAGLTQAQLAAAIGTGRTAIANWETGVACPRLQDFPDLCRALKTTPNELLGFTE